MNSLYYFFYCNHARIQKALPEGSNSDVVVVVFFCFCCFVVVFFAFFC